MKTLLLSFIATRGDGGHAQSQARTFAGRANRMQEKRKKAIEDVKGLRGIRSPFDPGIISLF